MHFEQGHGGYLLEQNEKSQDNFIINIGSLPSGKECHIQIGYVSELDLVQNGTKIRFIVPTTIAPRYNLHKGAIESPADSSARYIQSFPYIIDFRCRIDRLGITRVSSSSHLIQVDLSQERISLDHDIFIDIKLSKNRSNTTVAIGSDAIMASFTPNEQVCQIASKHIGLINEFIFVVDCSE